MADATTTGQGLFTHIATCFSRGAVALPDLGTLYREDSVFQAEGHHATGLGAIAGFISPRVRELLPH